MKNIVLIGMPGSGKSTVGVILAKTACMHFVDTDISIQEASGRPLHQIVEEDGYLRLRDIESEVISELHTNHSVIATGGSAVYCPAAMDHLRASSVVVYLDVPLPELIRRVGDCSTRGIATAPGQSFESLFNERTSLYQQYADVTISVDGQRPEELAVEINGAFIRALQRK